MFKVFSTLTALFMAVSAKNWVHKQTRPNDVIMPPLVDNSTYGNTDQIHTQHVHLALEVDFDERTLSGTANHTMEVLEATSIAQFDIWDLIINSVTTNDAACTFTILTPNPIMGQVLQISLDREYQAGETVAIVIDYVTSSAGQAFSWLNAE
jgi:leukotriene-A4 hydrolase